MTVVFPYVPTTPGFAVSKVREKEQLIIYYSTSIVQFNVLVTEIIFRAVMKLDLNLSIG